MTVISVSDLSLSFGNESVLENVSFSLNENDKMGIIGINGSGKTTLFKLILGEYEADSGSVFISKDKSVGVLRQDGAFKAHSGETPIEVMHNAFPELLCIEKRLSELSKSLTLSKESEEHLRQLNEYERLNSRYINLGGLEYKSRCESILKRMGYDEISMNSPVETLSGGQKTRLSLSVQLCREPDILMLDEPTNHLDIETLTWLESFLASYKKCVLVISHDRYFLDRVTNKTLIIEHKRARLYTGGYTESCKKRDEEYRANEKHYKEQQKEIARQQAYIAQQRQFNRERNIIAAESRLKLLEKMEKIERPKEQPKPINLKFREELRSGNDVMSIKNLSVGYNGVAVAKGLDFEVKRKERIFIIGPNGCGKSTLIKTMIGNLDVVAGKIKVGYNVIVGYYDQENQNLSNENTVLSELWNAYPEMKESEVRGALASFRFFADDVFKKVDMLSGGERARLTLAKLILSHMNLLILDEPTNHLDIDSKEALESALCEFDGTIIVVSHDRYFIDKIATRIIAMKPSEVFGSDFVDFQVGDEKMGYTKFCEYEERKESEGNFSCTETQNENITDSKEEYLRAKKESSDSRKAQKRFEKLTKEKETLEKRVDELNSQLYGEAATDYVKAAEISEEIEKSEERLMEIYEEIGI